ncbi:hypothetical protein DFS34DRAFT_603110 [Phlyctochytrium arcticum]|nr:hypothetical protein DFS34DRAFT_603110 [Phlyctochytrium arcticum]
MAPTLTKQDVLFTLYTPSKAPQPSTTARQLTDDIVSSGQELAQQAPAPSQACCFYNCRSSQRHSHSGIDASAEGNVQDVYAAGVAGQEMTDKLVRAVVLESNHEDAQAQRLIQSLHARITASGAVAHEEILEILLQEARRIQWETAASPTSKNNAKTLPYQIPTPRSASNLSDNESARAQSIVKEMYAHVTAGGAADAEGMVDMLLNEGLEAFKMMKRGNTQRVRLTAKL